MKKQYLSLQSKKGSKTITTRSPPKITDFIKKLEEKNNLRKQETSTKSTDNLQTIGGYPIAIDSDDKDHTNNIKKNIAQIEEELLNSPSKKRKNAVDGSDKSAERKSPKKRCISPIASSSTKRSPLKQIDLTPVKLRRYKLKTPEKCVKNGTSKPRTPPAKLFQKTPQKIEDFSVEVLKKFVTITPSKSSVVSDSKRTPTSAGKVQASLLQYLSPSTSNRSVEAQKCNEMTPKKDISANSPVTPTSRAKAKLNFDVIGSVVSTASISKENLDEDKTLLDSAEILEILSQNSLDDFCSSQFMNTDFEGDIDTQKYSLDFSQSKHCKIVKMEKNPSKWRITVKSTSSEEFGVCIWKDFWLNTKLDIGDKIHIMAKKVDEDWLVDNHNGLIVYEPDLLISSTSVVNSIFCPRRNVLSDTFQSFDCTNEFMVLGSLVHSVLQETLRRNVKTLSQIEEISKTILTSKNTIKTLYNCNQTVEAIRTKMSLYIPRILEFVECYVEDKIKNGRKRQPKGNCWQGSIDSIEDIEDNIWCPDLGVKGRVDVSIKTGENIMPLELKTGKPTFSPEHRGQVLLYIMMMNKLGYKISSGLLLYLRDGIVEEISISENERRDIMILRNELAYYLTRKPRVILSNQEEVGKRIVPAVLPDPINHHSACGICPQNVICSAFLEYNKDDLSANKPLQKVRDEVLSHLKQHHLNYFIKWSSLLNLETITEKFTKPIHQIYTMSPEEREKGGKCINYLKISNISDECEDLMDHTFVKIDHTAFNFFASGIGEGSYSVVSTNSRPAIVSGFVTHVDAHSITIALDRNLKKKYPAEQFHIDTYESSATSSLVQTSLALLLEPSIRAEELRSIIIDKKTPTFRCKLPKVVASKGIPILKKLNKIQRRAVIKAISANDFLLIKGMPGTGKTATIVALIELLSELGKTVLVTSHTHSAVDNVCARLQKQGVDFLRLGALTKISDCLKLHSEHHRTKECTTPEQLATVYDEAKVIASTVLGSGHPLLSKRILDVCIVDESTQVVQAMLIKPLYAAKTFILVGDPEQLPPVVKNTDAIEMGMSESLFDRLQSTESTISLTINYRMNKIITDLANALTYNGELSVANDFVGMATLNFPKKKELLSSCENCRWIMKVLDTSLKNSVQLIDTGPVWKRNDEVPWILKNKNGSRTSVSNIYEASITVNLVNYLIKGGVKPENIGIMATFTGQVQLLSSLLPKTIDVSTVDQFQGKDKNVIIYSCTKSTDFKERNIETSKFEILDDHRRLNVAVTRAKNKLIIVGDLETLKNYKPFAKLFTCLKESNIMRLEENVYDFSWSTVLNNVKG